MLPIGTPLRPLTLVVALVAPLAAWAQPEISVAPASLSQSLGPAATGTQTLTVTNSGTAPLTFTANRAGAAAPGGGPDAFGHTWTDSDRPGGPVYQWIDIRETGTRHALSSVGEVWVDLPFAFPFYGASYTRMKVYADGLVSFLPTYQGSLSNNRPIPYWDSPDLFIAGFWDDLDPSRPGAGVYTGVDARGRFVVQYDSVALAGPGPTAPPGRFTFEIILDPSGTIYIQYGSMTGTLASATVGIENATSDHGGSTTGVQVVYNAPYVHEGLSVRIARGEPWLSVAPVAGTIQPGASAELTVGFSSYDLSAGTLQSGVVLGSNDPGTPTLDVPVALTVLGEPDVTVSPAALDFGDVYVGGSSVRPLQITNSGTAPLTIVSVASSGAPFFADLTGSPTMAPGEQRTVAAKFEPAAIGTASGALSITTDDPDEPVVTVALAGVGVPAPDVSVTPVSLSATLASGASTTRTLTVANGGASELTFDLVVQSGAGLQPLLSRASAAETPGDTRTSLLVDGPDPGATVALRLMPDGTAIEGFTPALDSIYYDAGQPTASALYGWTPGRPFFVANRFSTDRPFVLTAVRTYVRQRIGEQMVVEVYRPGAVVGDATSGQLLRSVTVTPNTPFGGMVEVPLGAAVEFAPGEDFYIVIGFGDGSAVMGADHTNSGRSYYRTPYGPTWYPGGSTTWVIRALATGGAWISANPSTGTVAPGAAVDVTVTLDASILPGGTYAADLVVESNDPDEPALPVPVALTVTGVPDIVLVDDSLAFGAVYVGASEMRALGVRNFGSGPLTVTGLSTTDPAYTVSEAMPFMVGVGQTRSVEVLFAPDAPGPRPATLSLASDDPDEPELTVVLDGEGLASPDVAVTPDSLNATLPIGQTTTLALTISNEGAGTLSYEFQGFGEGALTMARSPQPYRELEKGSDDPRAGHAVRGGGGPDGYGYRWIDSDELGGPTFEWNDIRSQGTALSLGDDQVIEVDLPFGFPFYGESRTSVRVSSNGLLHFGTGGGATSFSNQPIPVSYSPNGFIAAFWDDLNPAAGGEVHYFADPSMHRFVVQYTDVPRFLDAASRSTFQVTLHSTGVVEIHYRSVVGVTNSATVGIEDILGEDGLEIAFNAPYVHDSLAVRIATTPAWIAAVNPASGTLDPGASVGIGVALDASSLQGGVHSSTLVLASNDPDEPLVSIPVTLTAVGVPDVAVVPDALEFGPVYAGGGTSSRMVTVTNTGSDVLGVSSVTSSGAAFQVDGAGFSVGVGQSRDVAVTFAPSAMGAFTSTLTVSSDDPDEPAVTVALTGEGALAPEIAVAPDSVFVALEADTMGTASLTIANTGPGPLAFSFEGYGLAARAEPRRDIVNASAPEPVFAKEAVDPRTGTSAAMGGPDAFGYHWIDSDEPGGPVFAWVDIAGSGTLLALGDDEAISVPLPFPFSFYGQTHTAVVVSSNGFLSFGAAGATAFTNSPIPRTAPPSELIAPFWDDLNPAAGGAIYAGTDSLGRFVVQWDEVPRYGTGNRYTFEAILDHEGRLLFQYRAMQGPLLDLATVGIENKTGTAGLEIAFNAPYVHDGLAVRIAATPQWLADVSPATGIVAPGATAEVTLSFDTDGLEAGVFADELTLHSNDPFTPTVDIPVTVEVTGDLRLNLVAGWNLVSWSVAVPDPAPQSLLAPILDRVLAVESIRDGERRVWMPGGTANTLALLEPTYSYWVRLSAPATLSLRGAPVAAQTPLPLSQGANAVAYLPRRAASIAHALGGVAPATTAASTFEGTGLTYAPSVPENYHVLAQMEPKAGYVLHLTAPATLVYPGAGGPPGTPDPAPRPTLAGRLLAEDQAGVVATPQWVSVWGGGLTLPDGSALPAGTRVVALGTGGTVCGSFDVVSDGDLGLMAVYADDPYTVADEGATVGESIALRFGEVVVPDALIWSGFGDVVDLSGLVVAGESGPNTIPTEFALEGVSPNPIREAAAVRYALPEASRVRLVVYDMLGRVVATLVDGDVAEGRHSVVWPEAAAAAGAYVVTMDAGEFRASRRVTVLR